MLNAPELATPVARAYVEAQRSTVLPAGAMLLSGAVQLAQAATRTNVWESLTGGGVLVLVALGLLWRIRLLGHRLELLAQGQAAT